MSENEPEDVLGQIDPQGLLEFELQMFLDIVYNDGLVIAAKGLNLHLIIFNILKVYCDPGNLVLVLNASDAEEKYFSSRLENKDVYSIKFNTNIKEREDVYLSGGIHFVTTQVLVLDMLKKRLPIEKITGIVVLRAHKIFESCQEAFILRLYRQSNKTGFIKAFTNSSQSFTVGFGHVERTMRALFVKELFLWPRFHSTVVHSLTQRQPSVIELNIPISENMKKSQTHILDLMNLTVKELKRLNKFVELEEITVENCLTKKYHKILQAQLDVIWHQLSDKSHKLVAELKTLRHLMITMLYADAVTFYALILDYKKKEYALNNNWTLTQPAELLFTQVSSFIYNSKNEFEPEFCPKWKPLLEVLTVEIPNHIKITKKQDNTILVLCSDNRTCHQISTLLTNGPHFYLFQLALKKDLNLKKLSIVFKNCENLTQLTASELNKNKEKMSKNKKLKTADNKKDVGNESKQSEENQNEEETEEFHRSYCLTMTQSLDKLLNITEQNIEDSQIITCTQTESLNFTQLIQSSLTPKILIQTFKGSIDDISLEHTLEEIKPDYIIMYHCNVTAIREIEMYEAHRDLAVSLKVYLLLHADTVEEQSYLTALRREKEAFEFLINTKSTMIVPNDQDGKSEDCVLLQRELISPTKNTRQGGSAESNEKQMVIVDMREFRSELPALIHKRGVGIEPMTITVGDYILSPEICVERKSLSDLIGSLNSGRLYQQCTQMSRYYSKPMLLIEFSQNKQFGWQNSYMISSDGDHFDIQKKLLLLTMHFPKLKIIWSPSPYATAQLFEELKSGKEQPNVQHAAAIGINEDVDMAEAKYNTNIYDFVQKLPGVNSKNIDTFLRKAQNLVVVAEKTEEELKEYLGNSVDSKAFYSIMHDIHVPKEDQSVKFKGKSKFRNFNK